MNVRYIISALVIGSVFSASAAVSVTGSDNVVSITPPKTSGLEAVFVVEDAGAVQLTYTASSSAAASQVRWKRFSSMGGGYAEEIASSVSGAESTVTPQASDMGYIVEDGGRQTAYWLVNYANHRPTLGALTFSAENDCDRVYLVPDGTFDRIVYYSVNGAPIELDRDIELTYRTLQSDNSDTPTDASWSQVTESHTLSSITGTFSVEAPLCDSEFTLTGDRFLRAWGRAVSVSTATYVTQRVTAMTWAEQATRDIPNESNSGISGLGGSAPCDITFTAMPTDAAVFTEWQFSATEDFADVLYRFSEPIFTYTFTEYGTTYVRFVCADASGQCEYDSDVYTVMVGESKLQCPNAFSPTNQDSVNDEWRVSYSSLVSYQCNIFSRWGKEVFSSSNPAEGWDGRIGSKFAPSGVYFYVIKAEGADGKKYNLSGDINIVGSRANTNQPSTTE